MYLTYGGFYMLDSQIGERIRELREIQHYTREYFAEKIDISSKFLYEIETGKKGFSVDILKRMSEVLSVSCDYILLGEDKEHRTSEKIVCVLETLEPKQVSRMQEILKILYDMSNSI
jgi:transcriptional regulator with XRE-family HTH domain